MTRRVLYIIIGVGLLLGCGERKEYVDVLQRAIATADEHPDSALVMLDSLARHEVDFGKHFLMQYRLHRLNVYNKLDTVFKTTEEAQQLADYFEDNGTSNEKMLAYYLLGRTYYDTHEAPMALKYFRTAAEKADTTAADCNYRQLSRVYGQMGNLFYEQNLMSNSLTCRDRAIAYAWRAKDTISVLTNSSSRIAALSKIVDADSIIELTLSTSKQAMSLGYDNVSAGILVFAIRRLVEKGDFVAAKSCMDLYESASGYFDENHQIEKGREIYYHSKGLYYLGIEKYDSAEYYFRLELENGKDFNNQNAGANGLARLFQLKHMGDSAAKYALYSYEMNDSVYAQMVTREVEQLHSLYDYTRNQELARLAKEETEIERNKVHITIGVLILFALLSFCIGIIVFRKQKLAKIKYQASISALAKMQLEVTKLRTYRDDYDWLICSERMKFEEQINTNRNELNSLITEKENEIKRLSTSIESYKEKLGLQKETADAQLLKSDVYKGLRKLAAKAVILSGDEWHKTYMLVIDIYPNFYKFISSKKLELNDNEFNTCILIRLGFTPKEISNMLGVSSSYITKIRTQMLKKFFDVEGKSKDFDEKLMEFS